MPKFFQAGQQELRSTQTWSQNSGDRPAFQADVQRGLFRSGHFQVFAMPRGLLFLEMRLKDYGQLGGGGGVNIGQIALAVNFGMLGAFAGAMAAQRDAQRYGSRPADRWEAGFDLLGEDDLLELARQRKKSFVAKIDEILSVTIDAPGALGRMLGDSSVAGHITLRDKVLGKVKMQVRDQSSMAVAVDALPRKLGERARVNVAFDQSSRQFVRR
jgi:hypothetical protein